MVQVSAPTRRQAQVLEFIRDYCESNGFSPTIREIADGFSMRSPNAVYCHLKALSRRGLIVRESKLARTVRPA